MCSGCRRPPSWATSLRCPSPPGSSSSYSAPLWVNFPDILHISSLYLHAVSTLFSVLSPLYLRAIPTLSPRYPHFISALSRLYLYPIPTFSMLSPLYLHTISTLSPRYPFFYLRATPALLISALSLLYLRPVHSLSPRYHPLFRAIPTIFPLYLNSGPCSAHMQTRWSGCSLLRNFTRFDWLIYYIFINQSTLLKYLRFISPSNRDTHDYWYDNNN